MRCPTAGWHPAMGCGIDRLILAVLVVAGSTGGCLLIPHAHRRGPDLRVEIVEHGEPVAGVVVKRVLALQRDECSQTGEAAVTDREGRVSFPRRYQFRWLIPLYGDPVDPMVLCIYRGGDLLGAAEFTLMGGAPSNMEVACDLALLRAGQGPFCGSPSWIDERRREMAGANDAS